MDRAQPLTFLTLPAEIRTMIYRILSEQCSIEISSVTPEAMANIPNKKMLLMTPHETAEWPFNVFATGLDLLATCKQIYREAGPILLPISRVTISCPAMLSEQLPEWVVSNILSRVKSMLVIREAVETDERDMTLLEFSRRDPNIFDIVHGSLIFLRYQTIDDVARAAAHHLEEAARVSTHQSKLYHDLAVMAMGGLLPGYMEDGELWLRMSNLVTRLWPGATVNLHSFCSFGLITRSECFVQMISTYNMGADSLISSSLFTAPGYVQIESADEAQSIVEAMFEESDKNHQQVAAGNENDSGQVDADADVDSGVSEGSDIDRETDGDHSTSEESEPDEQEGDRDAELVEGGLSDTGDVTIDGDGITGKGSEA